MDVLSSQSLSPIQSITLPSPPIKSHLVAVSVNYFVLVGVSTEGVCLSLWDTHYFTNQAGSLITSDLFTVCSAGNYVVVCGSESVTVAMVKTSFVSGTLAAALGRGHSSFDAITLSLVSVSAVCVDLNSMCAYP